MNKQYFKTLSLFLLISLSPGRDYIGFQINVNNNPYSANLFINTMGIEPRYLAILDTGLSPTWFVNSGQTGIDFKVNQQKLSYFDKPNQSWIIVNEFMNEIDTLECANGYRADYHDIILTDDGGYILQAYDSIFVNMSTIVSGGFENARIITLIIQEFDVNDSLVFEWNAWDHLNISDYTNLNLTQESIVWMHGNSIEIDNDANLIISNRRSSEIIKINRTTGNVIWCLGGPNNQYSIENDPLNGFSKQHDVRRINNGNIMLFDNGNEHEPPISRAVEYSIDETEMTAELIWDYSHPEGYVGLAMGSVQRLPNNNTLINWGTLNNRGAIITEVDYDKNIVLEIEYPPNIRCYKVRKDNWNFLTNLIPGDTNLDNETNIFDLYNISNLTFLVNENLDLFHLYRYDLNKDRQITMHDIELIVLMITNQ
jgi:hypothetical protein